MKTTIMEAGLWPKNIYIRQNCKKWNCPKCGPIMAWQRTKDIAKIAEEKNLDRFLYLSMLTTVIKTYGLMLL